MLIEREVQQAREIQETLRNQLVAWRADGELTDRARRRGMARAVLAARDQLSGLRKASAAREEGERRKAYQEAFGIDQARSAEERALRSDIESASPSAVDTRARMVQALRIGDLLQAKVLAAYSFDRRNDEFGGDHFRDTLDMYAGHSDGLTRQMTNLAIFDADSGNSGPAKLQRLTDKLITEVPQPSDLPGSLEFMAADDQPEPGNSGANFGVA